ncbi:hypothetical protein H5410_024980 [Solanum commersonii]|uniref:Uncharacterized protein n=1 Tax=Solanum commersonii TaxID=4109 RepID=A0A9J5YUN5_SOLCO|nr:hypothetical protein H5410_024980 [Solanum commersonii]
MVYHLEVSGFKFQQRTLVISGGGGRYFVELVEVGRLRIVYIDISPSPATIKRALCACDHKDGLLEQPCEARP